MNILNFSHPLNEGHVAEIAKQVGVAVQQVQDVRVQFSVDEPFVAQVEAMIDGLGISTSAWQDDAWLIVLPSLNYIAAILLAELHGRMGHFPAIVRLKPTPDALVTRYEVAEIINLESVRQAARTRR